MNKTQQQAQSNKQSDQLEQLWEDLLSRHPDRIQAAYASLEASQQKAVLAHLRRMVKEAGWQPEQRLSARAALNTIGTRSNQDK